MLLIKGNKTKQKKTEGGWKKVEPKLPTLARLRESTLSNLTRTGVIPVTVMIYLHEASPRVYKNENRLLQGDRCGLKSTDTDKHAFRLRKVSYKIVVNSLIILLRGKIRRRIQMKAFSHTDCQRKTFPLY